MPLAASHRTLPATALSNRTMGMSSSVDQSSEYSALLGSAVLTYGSVLPLDSELHGLITDTPAAI
jgi:hypothetical protein